MGNKKVNFDKVLEGELDSRNSEVQQEEVLKQFDEFLDKPVPSEVEAYSWQGNDILIEVFRYMPEGVMDFDINDETSNKSNYERYFSFGKVLAASEKSEYNKGDIIKLSDVSSLTIESSSYKDWVKNPLSKSNMKQKGKEPQRYITNIHSDFGNYLFILNPLNLGKLDSHEDAPIYKIPDRLVECKVNDPSILMTW